MYSLPMPKKEESILERIAYSHQFDSAGSQNPLGFVVPREGERPWEGTPTGWAYGDREHRVPPQQFVEEGSYDNLDGLGDLGAPPEFKTYKAGETIQTPWGPVTVPFDLQGPAGAEASQGFGQTGQQVLGTAVSAGTPVAIAAATSASLTVPIIGAAIAGVTAIIGIFMANAAKYHAQEAATTKIADQTSALMQQNLAAWNQSEKYVSQQKIALANFDQLQANMDQQCLQSQYGDPGKRCAAERDRGGIYDQYASMRDPIANDPNVKPDPVTLADGSIIDPTTGNLIGTTPGSVASLRAAGVNVGGSSLGNMLPLLIAGGLIAVAFLIPEDKGKGAKS